MRASGTRIGSGRRKTFSLTKIAVSYNFFENQAAEGRSCRLMEGLKILPTLKSDTHRISLACVAHSKIGPFETQNQTPIWGLIFFLAL